MFRYTCKCKAVKGEWCDDDRCMAHLGTRSYSPTPHHGNVAKTIAQDSDEIVGKCWYEIEYNVYDYDATSVHGLHDVVDDVLLTDDNNGSGSDVQKQDIVTSESSDVSTSSRGTSLKPKMDNEVDDIMYMNSVSKFAYM
jgi:hypothetical protein